MDQYTITFSYVQFGYEFIYIMFNFSKVLSAKAAIDVCSPTQYSHVIIKPKKVQSEKERQMKIEEENERLLQKLGDIMRTKRLKNFWPEPRPK